MQEGSYDRIHWVSGLALRLLTPCQSHCGVEERGRKGQARMQMTSCGCSGVSSVYFYRTGLQGAKVATVKKTYIYFTILPVLTALTGTINIWTQAITQSSCMLQLSYGHKVQNILQERLYEAPQPSLSHSEIRWTAMGKSFLFHLLSLKAEQLLCMCLLWHKLILMSVLVQQ